MKPRHPLTCIDSTPGRAAVEREAADRAQALAVASLTFFALVTIALLSLRK